MKELMMFALCALAAKVAMAKVASDAAFSFSNGTITKYNGSGGEVECIDAYVRKIGTADCEWCRDSFAVSRKFADYEVRVPSVDELPQGVSVEEK